MSKVFVPIRMQVLCLSAKHSEETQTLGCTTCCGFTRAARDAARNNSRGPLPQKLDTHDVKELILTAEHQSSISSPERNLSHFIHLTPHNLPKIFHLLPSLSSGHFLRTFSNKSKQIKCKSLTSLPCQ